MKIRITALALAVIVLFSLSACAKQEEQPGENRPRENGTASPSFGDAAPPSGESFDTNIPAPANTPDINTPAFEEEYPRDMGTGEEPTAYDSTENQYEPNVEYPGLGNTNGNIRNRGLAAIQNDWIYFQNDNDKNSLYKMRLDGSDRTKLNDEYSRNINIIGDWIFYINKISASQIVKIRTDGTDRQIVSPPDNWVNQFIISDGGIYYITPGDLYVYRMSLDGNQHGVILLDTVNNFNIEGDVIYYTRWSDSNKIYSIHKNGSSNTQLNTDRSSAMSVDDNWIYFSADLNFYKMRIDGTETTKLTNDNLISINISDDWIYYTAGSTQAWAGGYNPDKGLYKMRLDGSEKTMLCDGSVRYINVVGDLIIFETFTDDWTLYKVNTDGTNYGLLNP